MSGAVRRDEFSQKVKTTLAQRVNYLCSNPSCHEFTSGPHSDHDKPLILGIAAHICAASPGGPRYDAAQTPEERSSTANGIWLCDRHARQIDADQARFPVSLLHDWKAQTEAFVAGGNPSPSLPRISLRTLSGLRLIAGRIITAENADIFRDHELIVENNSRLDLRDVQIRIQFPEPLLEFATTETQPIGTSILVQAPRVALESVPASDTAGLQVRWNLTAGDPAEPSRLRQFDVMLVHASRLPALQRIGLTLVSPRPSAPVSISDVLDNNSEVVFRYSVQGTFAFDWNREVRHIKVWSHLSYDPQARRVSSGPTLASHPAGRHVVVYGGLVGQGHAESGSTSVRGRT
jgi:hypothetical protein